MRLSEDAYNKIELAARDIGFNTRMAGQYINFENGKQSLLVDIYNNVLFLPSSNELVEFESCEMSKVIVDQLRNIVLNNKGAKC